MEQDATRQQISDAWRLHREGKSDDAIDGYQAILAGNAQNIDALYGVGLAYRSLGQTDRAVESFHAAQSALETWESERVGAMKAEEPETGLPSLSDPIAGEGDYYIILSRMIRQRLSELGVADT
ncbi:MAG: tetratricopeptide repeat protein [Chloroflexi bacterium]|nr:tetratricopeptide repeat protein [Chloroflexota bacterium]